MLEKEVEAKARNIYENFFGDIVAYPEVLRAIAVGVQKGAEFAYNKANEWHYVKDGDLPKGEGAVLIYWKYGDIKCVSVVEPYKVTEDTHIIAWKEIVLPKELKEK